MLDIIVRIVWNYNLAASPDTAQPLTRRPLGELNDNRWGRSGCLFAPPVGLFLGGVQMSSGLRRRAVGGGGGDELSVSSGAPEGSPARFSCHGGGFCWDGRSCRGPLGLTG